MTRQIAVLVLAGMISAAAVGAGFPKPAVVQKANEWTLTLKYEDPMQITLRVPGRQTPQRFWYLILSVTNESTFSDVPFVPVCELVTDNFKTQPAGHGVPKGVFEAIKRKHQGSYPFLESLDFEDNRVRRGADNTRDFVIVWPDFDPKAKAVHFFVAGLSNETAMIMHPIKTDADGNPERIFLQKTLHLSYVVGADAALRDQAVLNFNEKTWVMR